MTQPGQVVADDTRDTPAEIPQETTRGEPGRRLGALWDTLGSDRVREAVSSPVESVTRLWRRSLQFRVVATTVGLSLAVILAVAFILQWQMVEQLRANKEEAAIQQISGLRASVEAQIAATDDGTAEQSRLDSARLAISDRGFAGSEDAVHAGTFEPILLIPGEGTREQVLSPANAEVPPELEELVSRGNVAHQYVTTDIRGQQSQALLIGTATESRIPGMQLYILYPLISEEQTLQIMQSIFTTAGLAIILLTAAIAWVVARQVVLPVRQTASIAQRFSDGHLKERMLVRGEDDMARLALAFNEMAENLSTQITQLEEFGNLQKRFTSDVSHELRTPLTTVRMAADIIAGDAEDFDPPTKRAVELLESELDRFESLLADLLEVSRHDAGVAELSPSEGDVRSTVREAVDTVVHLAEQANIKVRVDVPDDAVIADIDHRRLERILRNLIANAIDHSEGKPVHVTMRASDSAVAASVRDFGVGLKPGEDALVFNRFWRADPSRVRRSGGTGLGLAISQEDAKLHGGRVDCWGSPGEGACFRVTLPRRPGEALVSSPLPLTPEDVAKRAVAASSSGPETAPMPRIRRVMAQNDSGDQ